MPEYHQLSGPKVVTITSWPLEGLGCIPRSSRARSSPLGLLVRKDSNQSKVFFVWWFRGDHKIFDTLPPKTWTLQPSPESRLPSQLALPNRMWQSEHCAMGQARHALGVRSYQVGQSAHPPCWWDQRERQKETESTVIGPAVPCVSEVGPRAESGTILDLSPVPL